jgi:hypothetical protein
MSRVRTGQGGDRNHQEAVARWLAQAPSTFISRGSSLLPESEPSLTFARGQAAVGPTYCCGVDRAYYNNNTVVKYQ